MTVSKHCRQRGLTLIELMISVALSLVILSAMSYIYVSSRGVYRSNEAMARAQETGRFALEWLARDIRNAGNFGCISYNTPQIIANPPNGIGGQIQAVFGYENGKDTSNAAWPNPSTITYVRGDVLIISGMLGNAANVTDNVPGNANVKVDQNCMGLQQDDLAIACNFKQATLFRVTNNVQQNCNLNSSPGYDVTAANNANTSNFKMPYTKDDRAILFKLGVLAYFIGQNPAGNPALYRVNAASTTLPIPTEEVAENIEDMNLLFGEDTNADGQADVYSNANSVVNWANVVSVRVAVVARSADTSAVQQSQTYYFQPSASAGVYSIAPTPTDRRLRQVFTTTVALRNRLP